MEKKWFCIFIRQMIHPAAQPKRAILEIIFQHLKKAGFVVIGVSPDDKTSHKKFEEKYHLPFTLVEDPQKKIIEKYEVWGEKNMYGKKYMGLLRTTFLIDEKGVIIKIFKKPKTKIHSEEILNAVA